MDTKKIEYKVKRKIVKKDGTIRERLETIYYTPKPRVPVSEELINKVFEMIDAGVKKYRIKEELGLTQSKLAKILSLRTASPTEVKDGEKII